MRVAPIAVTAASLFLAGCGFQPLYGTLPSGSGAGQSLTHVYVEPIPERMGYELRNTLLDLFNADGSPADANYRLRLTLSGNEEAVVLQPNTAITDRKSTRLNSSHVSESRMPSSA